MARQERAALAGYAGPAGGYSAGAFLRAAFAGLLLLGHHGGDAAAARRAVQQTDRRAVKVERQPVEMGALHTNRAVGVPTARGEIVGAHHGRPAIDLAPAAD